VRLFGIRKRGTARIFPPDWLTIESKQIYRLLGAWIGATTPPNIISAFKQVGIHAVWDPDHRGLEIRVDSQFSKRSVRVDWFVMGWPVYHGALVLQPRKDNSLTSAYAAELCTSCTISEILGAQRAQNAGQGNLTYP
jgi:hypothetical protein